MITTLIVLGSVAAYLGIGVPVGRSAARRIYAYSKSGYHPDDAPTNAKLGFWSALLFWPVAGFILLCIGAASIDRVVPQLKAQADADKRWAAEAALAEAQAEVVKLHRELGIKPLEP